MPISYKTTLYGCIWKCGARRTPDQKRMEKHELTCFSNPEHCACRTCKFDIKTAHCRVDLDGGGLYCEIDVRPCGVNAVSNCADWVKK